METERRNKLKRCQHCGGLNLPLATKCEHCGANNFEQGVEPMPVFIERSTVNFVSYDDWKDKKVLVGMDFVLLSELNFSV